MDNSVYNYEIYTPELILYGKNGCLESLIPLTLIEPINGLFSFMPIPADEHNEMRIYQ